MGKRKARQASLSLNADLDPEEFQALQDLLGNKEEDVLSSVYEPDYHMPPVGLDQFLDDPYYMGDALGEDGIYPYWREALHKVEAHEGPVVVFTGAKRTGKSSNAVLFMAYQFQHVVKMIQPQRVLGAQLAVSPIVFSFFSLSQKLVEAESYGIFNEMLLASPFFKEQCDIRGRKDKIIKPPKRIQFALGSPFVRGKGILGKNIIAGLLDEISELSDADEFNKQKAFGIFLEVIERMIGTYSARGKQFGKLFLVSTSDRPAAFIEAYIDRMRDDPNVLIFEPKLWDVKPKGTYSSVTFPVAVGNKYLDSKKLAKGDDPAEYEKLGYSIIHPPIDFEHPFSLDPDGACRRLAGISTSSSRANKLIPSKECIRACIIPTRRHPFRLEVPVIGTKDNVTLEGLFLPDAISYDRSLMRTIHIDIGLTEHPLGMVMAHSSGAVSVSRWTDEGKQAPLMAPMIRVDFALRVKSPPNDEVSLIKICDFVVALKVQFGFAVAHVSFDGYQSRHAKQVLRDKGIETEEVSVHRDHIPYFLARAVLLEVRAEYYDYPPLLNELEGVEIQHVRQKKKICPPFNGSDDVADGFAGVVEYLERETVQVQEKKGLLDVYRELSGRDKKKRRPRGKEMPDAMRELFGKK